MKITTATLFGAVAAALVASAAIAADSGDRTSMPEACADRNTNCVIQDGPPRRRGGGDTAAKPTPPAGSGTTDSRGSSAGSRSGNRSGDTSSGTSR